MRRHMGLGLVVGIGGAPVRFDEFREPSWPIAVLTEGALTTWYWSEYSGGEWSELTALESSGKLPSSPPGEGELDEAQAEGRPSRRERRRHRDEVEDEDAQVFRKTT